MSILRKNILYNFLNQVLIVGLPLFINIYLVRVLHLSDLGHWYLVTSSAAIAQLIFTAPHFWILRVLGNEKDNSESIILAGACSYLLLLGAVTPVYFSYHYFFVNKPIFVATGVYLTLLASVLSFEFVYQSYLKQRFLMLRRLVTRMLLIVFLLLFVNEPDDFNIFFIGTVAIFIIEHLIGLCGVLLMFGAIRSDSNHVKRILRSSLEMIPFNTTHNTLPHAVILVASKFLAMEHVAALSILVRIFNMITTFVTSSINVVFPYLLMDHNEKSSKGTIFNWTIFCAFVFALGTYTMKDFIVFLFLNNTININLNFSFLALSIYIVVHSAFNFIAFNDFVKRGKTIYVTLINFLVLVIFSFFIIYFDVSINMVSVSMVLSAGLGFLALSAVKIHYKDKI